MWYVTNLINAVMQSPCCQSAAIIAFWFAAATHRDAESNDMLACFDFHQKPLPPDVISTSTELDFSDLKTATP
jgi:hypothetical protein